MHLAALSRYSTRQNTLARLDRARAGGASNGGTHASTSSSIPEALPCRKFDALFPRDSDVWGNILVTDETELQRWAMFCRPISREEAEETGGCVIFHPRSTPAQGTALAPRYFSIATADDTVYGRAAYLSECAIVDEAAAGDGAEVPRSETHSTAMVPGGAKVECSG